jgi:hypothetical protein
MTKIITSSKARAKMRVEGSTEFIKQFLLIVDRLDISVWDKDIIQEVLKEELNKRRELLKIIG